MSGTSLHLLPEACLNWHVLRVKTGRETLIRGRLERDHIDTFLPTYHVDQRYSHRKPENVERALFPGYVFVRPARAQRPTVLQTVFVIDFLRNVNQIAVVSDAEIADLRRMVETHAFEPEPITVGKTVEVIDGPLKGMTGIVTKKRNKCRIVVNIPMLNRGCGCEIDPSRLRVLKSAA